MSIAADTRQAVRQRAYFACEFCGVLTYLSRQHAALLEEQRRLIQLLLQQWD